MILYYEIFVYKSLPSHVNEMDGVFSSESINCGCTTNFILVPSGYKFSIIGLIICPIFVLGLLNGNSPKHILCQYKYININ